MKQSTMQPFGVVAACALVLAFPVAHAARFRGVTKGHGGAVDHVVDVLVRGERTKRVHIRKPVTDTREYVHTTFDTGLKVLAVRDPEAQKTGFAVAVEAGSLEDPSDFQGLAHFCEHMLFLGSKKYPETDEFSKHLALYGGTHNAYTSAEETVYYNEIGNDGIEKGLDIFAQFFISPSFKAEMVDKEIHAVDSEHKKNQPDMTRRLWHLWHSKANPENPMHQFATGDLQTLKLRPEAQNKSLVQALREFHRRNYCPSRLHLVLVGNSSTDDLLSLGHRHFDALAEVSKDSQCTPRPVYFLDHPPFSKKLQNIGRKFTVGTHGTPEMWVVLPTLPLRPHYKELPEAYIWNALAHYGPGSLKALLLREDLSQSYSYTAESTVAGSSIMLMFSLTERGAKNTDLVLEYLFAYLNDVRAAGVDNKLIGSLQQLRLVNFDYREKHSSEFELVSSLAGALPKYAPEDVLTGRVLMDKPDAALINEVLGALTPSNMNVVLVDPQFKHEEANQHEPVYDFKYREEALDSAFVARLAKAAGHGLLPPPDLQYVPRKLDLISEGAGKDGPEQLLKQGRVELWWLGMGEVKLPKAIISLKLGFPSSAITQVQDLILGSLHSRVLQLVLEETSDALQTCGVSYNVGAQREGISLSFSGFDEHILELVKMVMPRVRSPRAEASEFEMARRQLVLDLADITKKQPYQHALEAFEIVTLKDRFSRQEMLAAAQNTELVSLAAYSKFLDQVFAEARLTALFTGNIGKARSLEMTAVIESLIGITRDQPKALHDSHVAVVDPKEEVEVRVHNPIPNDPNSATVVSYQFGVPKITDRIHLAMLGEVIDRPVFEALRTERQLGYVVFGWVATHASIVEVRVLVQGFREQPDVVGGLIEDVVQNLTSVVASMSQEEFETRKQTLRSTLTKPAATMGHEAGRYWGQIWDQTYCFQKQDLQVKYLDSKEFSSPAPLLKAWRQAVEPTAHRKKVSVKLFGSKAENSSLELHGDNPTGKKVITLVDSKSVGKELEGEQYWPHEYICK